MTIPKGIDQAPQNNDPNQQRMQGSQDLFGSAPVNLYQEPARIDREPSNNRRNLLIAAGTTLGTLAAFTAIYLGSKEGAQKAAHELASPGNSAPVFSDEITPVLPGDWNRDGVVTHEEYSRMPPADFIQLTDRTRVADLAPKLQEGMQDSYTRMRPSLNTLDAKVLYMPMLQKTMDKWTDQDYLNYYSIALHYVSTRGDSQSQIDEGRRLLSVVIDPDHPEFDSVSESFGNVDGYINVYRAEPSSATNHEIFSQTLGGVQFGDEGGRFVKAVFLSDGKATQVRYLLFANRSDENGDIAPMLVNTFQPGDPKISTFLPK